jgi:hypothetical protein
VERIDSVLSQSSAARPDIELFTAQARLLRGSATMARQLPIADLASALERIGRAVRDDIIEWTPALNSALIAAVDDLKILIRAARNWGAGDDRRTEERISELVSLYPQANKKHLTPPATLRNSSFIASESAQLATALDTLVSNPSSSEALAVAVHRLSSLQGVAAINDTPPLLRILGALDDILRPLQLQGDHPATAHLAVLTAAVQLIRRFSQEIAIGGMLDAGAKVIENFDAALAALAREHGDITHELGVADAVVPISRLNFEDGLPQLVSTGGAPAPTAAHRFRLEMSAPSEHLRHHVQLARGARDDGSRSNAAAEMRATLRVLRSTAAGFDEPHVVEFIDTIQPDLQELNVGTLMTIEEMARAFANPHLDMDGLQVRLRELLAARETARNIARATPSQVFIDTGVMETFRVEVDVPGQEATGAVEAQPAAAPVHVEVDTPAPAHVEVDISAPPHSAVDVTVASPATPPSPPMTGAGLSQMLAAGIAGLSALDESPLSEPAAIAEDELVPVEDLLYRGRDAIARAMEIRESMLARTGTPESEELAEIFELLDLAVAD